MALLIGISAWTRAIDTALGDAEVHHTLAREYVDAIEAVGATPVILPSVDPSLAAGVVGRLDGLVISGGGDIDPAMYGERNTDSGDIDVRRDGWERALTLAAREANLPFLGICRGAQMLNVACGGTLRQHVWSDDGDHPVLWNPETRKLADGPHDVIFEAGSRLATAYGKDRRTVNSLHHQAIDRLGEGLRVVASAPDGTVEAVEAIDGWQALAVQWHPERLDLADERPLFEALIRR